MNRDFQLFTITGNLLAQTRQSFDMPRLGGTYRAIGIEEFSVGGKGVNCAIVGSLLGVKTYAAIFPAGEIGKKCKRTLKTISPRIGIICEEICGETRTGLVCVNSKDGVETTFLGVDLPVPLKSLEKILSKIGKVAHQNDIVALCGSFPSWNYKYAKILSDFCLKNKLRLCIDSYGKPLSDFAKSAELSFQPEVYKINVAEFLQLVGENFKLSPAKLDKLVLNFAKQMHLKCLIVTNGEKPARAIIGGKLLKITPPKIERELSATGCGDITTSIFICEFFAKNANPINALEIAMRAASLSAKREGFPAFSRAELANIEKSVFKGA